MCVLVFSSCSRQSVPLFLCFFSLPISTLSSSSGVAVVVVVGDLVVPAVFVSSLSPPYFPLILTLGRLFVVAAHRFPDKC